MEPLNRAYVEDIFGQVTSSNLSPGQVTSLNLSPDQVTSLNLSPGQVTSLNLASRRESGNDVTFIRLPVVIHFWEIAFINCV